MFSRSSERRDGGFTLIEMLVVIAIIAVLAAVVAPEVFRNVGDADVNAAKSQIEMLSLALDQYRLDNHAYPSTEAGMAALRTAPAAGDAPNWRGPYITRPISANYTVTADVTVENTLVRDTTPGVGLLDIKMDNVEQDVANQVERELDGAITGSSSTTGAVLWTTSSGTLVTLTFRFPVRGC